MPNMSEKDWCVLADAKGLDRITGSRIMPESDPALEADARFDEWAAECRAIEHRWAAARPQPKPKWRLRWVQE